MAASLGAGRVEIAHAQYYGWAFRNRQALMPTRDQVFRAMQEMETIRPRYLGRLVIDLVVPDYYARRPKACMGGWARRSLNVTPSGRVLPCHAAETIPGLEFWSVRDRSLARDMARVAGVPGIPRHGMDAGAVPVLRSCARSILAAAAARRWRSPAMRRRPIRHANCRRITRACWSWPSRLRRGAEARYAYRGRGARELATPNPATPIPVH